jgi:uncharacterized membrane protein
MSAKAAVQGQEAAQYHYVKAKLYRIVSIIFAIIGLLLFFIFSVIMIDNDPRVLLTQPWLVLFMIMPFLPAYVLSMLAEKHRKKLKQLVEKKTQG